MGKQTMLEEYNAALAADDPTPEELAEDPFPVRDGFVRHPLLRPGVVQARAFQQSLARKAIDGSLMAVLPTGLGKTIIAVLAAAETLRRGEGKILFLAPTKPLVLQHRDSFEAFLRIPPTGFLVMTGTVAKTKRVKEWTGARVVFATPQVVANDLEGGRYTLEDVALIIFDEAHRAVGDYDYVPVAAAYAEQRADPRALGLTASPGGNRERIEEVMENLRIRRVEARDHASDDVAEYVQRIDVEWVPVTMTQAMARLHRFLNDVLREKIDKLRRSGFLTYRKGDMVSRKDILAAGEQIRARMGKKGGRKGYLFGAMHNQSVAMHAHHCLELLETQGVEPLRDYLLRMRDNEEPSRSEKSFLKDDNVQKAIETVETWKGKSHPKLTALERLLKKQFEEKPDSLVIVFTQYRDTIRSILRVIGDDPVMKADRFVGQATRNEEDPGLSQKDQKAALERFRRGDIRVLVASSVAEEGLDVPSVDLVVFFEPLPSEIRVIQRRGRTGRNEAGRVVVLYTKGSRDEAYLYAGAAREKKMKRVVSWLGRATGALAEEDEADGQT